MAHVYIPDPLYNFGKRVQSLFGKHEATIPSSTLEHDSTAAVSDAEYIDEELAVDHQAQTEMADVMPAEFADGGVLQDQPATLVGEQPAHGHHMPAKLIEFLAEHLHHKAGVASVAADEHDSIETYTPLGNSTIVPHLFDVKAVTPQVSEPEITVATATEKSNHMSILSKILTGTGDYFKGFFDALKGDAASLEAGIVSFVKTDVGKLAVDAVQYASTLTGDDTVLRDAAVAQLKADLVKTGKDAETIAESTLNLLIEAAYTYVKGSVANLQAKAEKGSVQAAPAPAA